MKIKVNLITILTVINIFMLPQASLAVKKKIIVWAMGYEGTKISIMARKFEKEHPDVEIITQAVPWGAAHEKLLTSIIGGVPPDVSQVGTTWIPEFQSMNAFAELDSFLDGSQLSSDDFFKSSFGIGRINGKIYGIPWYVDTRVLFYRKDILEKNGFDGPPRTWDEYISMCSKLKYDSNGDGAIDRYGISLPVKDWQMFLPILWQNEGSILSEDHSRVTVKTQEFAEAVRFYKSFYENEASPVQDPGYDPLWAFKKEIYPMFMSGPWMVDQIRREIPELDGKWALAMLPENKNRVSFVGGSHMALFKDSPNKDAAWQFIEFMSQPENQIEWFEIAGALPSNINSWKSGYFDDKPLIKVFGDQMIYTQSPPNIPEWEEIASMINQRVEEVMLDQITVQEMQNTLNRDIENILVSEDRGSGNVLLWFFIVTMLSALLLLLYANRAMNSNKNITVIQKDKIALESAPPGGMMGQKTWHRYYIPYMFILPAVLVLLIFLFLPIFSSFLFSMTNWNVYTFSDFSRLRFIGFDNYISLFGDKVFWQALVNTFVFSGVSIPLNIIIALFLAVVIDKKYIQNKAIYRAGYFMPVITTLVAVAVVWRWLYNPEYGLVNYVLGLIGIEKQTWLSSPKLALPALIVMSIWKNFGYNMVIVLAGLQTIPKSLYEAAGVDGADAWQSFWHITLPSLKPTLFFVFVMTTIGSLQFFGEPYIMTKGGPLNKTLSMVMYMYNQGFKFFKFGYATAIAYALFVCILIFTMIQIYYNRKLEAR